MAILDGPDNHVVPRRPMVHNAKDYELRDVVSVDDQGTWCSGSDIVGWPKTEGPHKCAFALGELARMIADFGVLVEEGVPFSATPGVAYELTQDHRRTAAVQSSLPWIEEMDLLEQENTVGSSGTNATFEGEYRRSA